MEALEYRVENFIVMELRGRVDELNTGVLRDEIHTIINTGRSNLAIDLQKTDFLSAHCLAAIWKCQRRARVFGGDIILFGAKGRVRETINFVKLPSVIACLSTQEEAIDHFRKIANQQRDSNSHSSSGSGHKPAGSAPHDSKAQTKTSLLSRALSRFFQYGVLFGLALYATIPEHAQAEGTPPESSVVSPEAAKMHGSAASDKSDAPLSLEELQHLARTRGAMARFQSLKKQERLQELEMTRSLQLPTIAFTTGYLYQSNPNLITELANRELNQLRQRGAESEFSEFHSNTNFKIDKDLVVLSVGVIQSIYSGGLYEAQQRLAESQITEQETQSRLESIKTQEQVETLYWGLLLTEKKKDLLLSKDMAAKAKLQATQAKFSANTISRSEVSEVKLEGLAATKELLEAQDEVVKLRSSLNVLIGRSPESPLQLREAGAELTKELAALEDYITLAENRHPELEYATARIDTALAYQETTRAAAVRSPKAFLFGGMDHTRGIADRTDLVNWSLGVAMSVPLYDGGRSFAETEKSRLLLEQARLGLKQAKQELKLNVREAVGAIRRASVNLEIAKQAQELAIDRARLARSAIEDGQIPAFELERAKGAEIEAQIAVLAAKAELLRWSAKLRSLTMEDNL